jgi:hypothetical protein
MPPATPTSMKGASRVPNRRGELITSEYTGSRVTINLIGTGH